VIGANNFSVVYLALLRFRASVACRVITVHQGLLNVTGVMKNMHLNNLFYFKIIGRNSNTGNYFRVNRTFTGVTKLRFFFPFKYLLSK